MISVVSIPFILKIAFSYYSLIHFHRNIRRTLNITRYLISSQYALFNMDIYVFERNDQLYKLSSLLYLYFFSFTVR